MMAERATSGTGRRWGEVLLWLAVAAMAVALVAWEWAPAQQPTWKYDEGVNVIKADLTLQGYRLYGDIWSDQPPLFTLLLAGAFRVLGHEVWVGRMLVAVLAALGALALAALVRRLAGRVAAALAAALLVTLPHYQTLGRQLLIGLPALAVALAALALAFWLADGRRGAGGAFLAGLVFGASLLIKPLTAPMLLPLALWCLLPPDWPATRRLRWRRGLWLAVGIALPAAAALAYYGSRAMAGQIVGTLLGAREGQDYTLGSNLAEIGVYLAADRWGLAYWGLPALAALGLGELWAARRRRELLVLAAWLLAAFAALALHTPLRGHEMILLMPPLLACGAMGIDAAVRLAGARRPAGGRRFLAAAGAMATVVAVLGTIGAVRADVQVRAEEMAAALPADDARILALLAETPAGSTIIVDDPMLAFESQRTIPPTLAVPSYRRVEAGELGAERLLALTRDSAASALVFGRRFWQLEPYVAWVRQNYALSGAYGGVEAHAYTPLALMSCPQPATTAEGIALVGSRVADLRAEPGGMLTVDVYLTAERTPQADYTLFVHLVDDAGNAWGQQDLPPLDGVLLTSAWQPGEIVRQRAVIDVAPDAPAGEMTLWVGLYGTGKRRLDWADGQGTALGNQVALTPRPVVRWTAEMAAPAMAQSSDAQFGDLAALRGYDVAVNEGHLGVTLYWQSLGETSTSYTVFLHVLDADGQLVAQQDARPGGGSRPTTGWIAGEYLADPYDIVLPEGVDAKGLRLAVGMYDLASGARLPVTTGGQVQPDGQVLLDLGGTSSGS